MWLGRRRKFLKGDKRQNLTNPPSIYNRLQDRSVGTFHGSDSLSVQSVGKGRSEPPEIAWGSDSLSRVVDDVNRCSPAGLDSHAFSAS